MLRLIFLLPLALCFTFQSNHVIATEGVIKKATTDALIQTACAATSSPPLCSSTLSAVANNPYANPCDIAITAFQAATKTAVATFDLINMSLTVKTQILSDPQLRQSLVVCAKEYKNVLDYMDKASTSLTQKVDTPQVPEYLNSAIGCIAKCDASGIKFTNKAVQVATKNVDATKLIKNALAIYQVFADYITNPSHDPSKGSAPMPDVPKVGSANPTSSGDGSKTSSANNGDDKGSDSATTKNTTSGDGSKSSSANGGDDKGSSTAKNTSSGGDNTTAKGEDCANTTTTKGNGSSTLSANTSAGQQLYGKLHM